MVGDGVGYEVGLGVGRVVGDGEGFVVGDGAHQIAFASHCEKCDAIYSVCYWEPW